MSGAAAGVFCCFLLLPANSDYYAPAIGRVGERGAGWCGGGHDMMLRKSSSFPKSQVEKLL